MTAGPPPPTHRPLPKRNPRTHAAHRREVFYQITIPLLFLLLILVLLMAGVIWAGVQGSAEVSRWADVSAIWLITPKIIGAFIQLILLTAITYGFIRLIAVLPPYFRIAQDFMLQVQTYARRFSNQVAEPFLKFEAMVAYLNAWRSKIFKRKEH